MLARQFRLPSSVRFQKAHSLHTPLFTVKIQSNETTVSRFGFIVSKAIDKRAVIRNHLKRLVRVRIETQWLKTKGKDMLFILRPAIKSASREEIWQLVDETMTKHT